jgi:hypothetical protein
VSVGQLCLYVWSVSGQGMSTHVSVVVLAGAEFQLVVASETLRVTRLLLGSFIVSIHGTMAVMG